MSWHGQINRTIWEIGHLIEANPRKFALRKELLRTHFLQRYEFDRSLHVPRDDRSFLFLQEGRAAACLLLHGAHGTPAEMRDLGNHLYSRGLTVYCPRLSRYDVKNRMVSWEAWVTMAEGALTTTLQYSSSTMVAGLSLGGTVTLVLSRLHPIKAMVLLAPAIQPRLGLKGRVYALARHVVPGLFYRFAGWDGEATKAMDHVRSQSDAIPIPTLVIQARNDAVVSSRGLKYLRRVLSNDKSDVVVLADGTHAIMRGPEKEEVLKRVFAFTESIELMDRPGRGDDRPATGGRSRGGSRSSGGSRPGGGRPGAGRSGGRTGGGGRSGAEGRTGGGSRSGRRSRSGGRSRGGRGRSGKGESGAGRKPDGAPRSGESQSGGGNDPGGGSHGKGDTPGGDGANRQSET